jgi:GH25 family lysozyme M1 (1,4-beta-N-acetylmuramidase)
MTKSATSFDVKWDLRPPGDTSIDTEAMLGLVRVEPRKQHGGRTEEQEHPIMITKQTIFISACAAVAFSMLAVAPSSTPGATQPLGIDVSNYQGTINWNSVAGTGISFAWAKATEGVSYTDPYLQNNEQNGTAAGVSIGAYDFAHPELNTPLAEAQYFVNYASQYGAFQGGHLAPALDLETGNGAHVGASSLGAWVSAWCTDVYDLTGARPVVYTGTTYASMLNSSASANPLWLADWIYSVPAPGSAPGESISPWSTWTFWQYSDAGSVSGISGRVDLDAYNGSFAAMALTEMLPAQLQLPSQENATTVTWTGAGTNGSWSNAANWTSAWTAGSVAEFNSSSRGTANITFDQAGSGNKVVNLAQIQVADINTPAVTINGSDTLEFQTYVDPIYNNSANTLTINAPMQFFGTMGTAANSSTNSIYAGPGNIVLGGNITFNDSQTQVVRFGFNDLIAVWDSHANAVPGNIVINGAISDAAGTPAAYTNGFFFSNAGGYDDITSNNSSWKGGMYVAGGATLLVAAGASTGTGAVTLNGTASGNNGFQPAGIHGGIAGEGTISGPVTVAGSGGFFTGGGKLINNDSSFVATTGKLTLANGLNLSGYTATFDFYLSGSSNSSILIGGSFTLSNNDLIALSGTPTAGIYHLIDYNSLINQGYFNSWTVSGPDGFSYALENNVASQSLDVIATAVPEPADLAMMMSALVALMLIRRRRGYTS